MQQAVFCLIRRYKHTVGAISESRPALPVGAVANRTDTKKRQTSTSIA